MIFKYIIKLNIKDPIHLVFIKKCIKIKIKSSYI